MIVDAANEHEDGCDTAVMARQAVASPQKLRASIAGRVVDLDGAQQNKDYLPNETCYCRAMISFFLSFLLLGLELFLFFLDSWFFVHNFLTGSHTLLFHSSWLLYIPLFKV